MNENEEKVALVDKRFIVTGLLVVFSVFFLGFFGQDNNTAVNPFFQTMLVSITFFLVVPALYSKIVLKESLKNLGWQRGRIFPGVFFSIVSVTLALGAVFLLTRYTSFAVEYHIPMLAQSQFMLFLVYELVLVTFTTLLYEFFFRGLIQMSWLRSFGIWAIFLQTALFIGLLFLSDDISWQRFPVIFFCPLAGIIAYYSKSIWYSWAASWIFLFLTDIFLLVIR